MSDELDDGQTARTNGSGQSVNIRLVGADRAFWIAVAVVMSLFSFLYCFSVNHEEAQRVYFENREEAFIEQLSFEGYKVPLDVLQHIHEEKR